jgi:hypothetical protein
MTAPRDIPSDNAWTVPELGPSLGRLVDPPPGAAGGSLVVLDDIRLRMVSALFELAGAARAFAASGDRDGAVASLGRVEWLGCWERAVEASASRIVAEANAGLVLAAEESRFPRRRLARLQLADEDTRAVAARLGSGGGPFVAALDALAEAGGGAAGRSPETRAREWREAVTAAARRLESAWLALEASAAIEQEHWAAEITQVRRWRRPTWSLWLLTVAVFAAAGYLGLVLGGYLPVPSALRGLAVFWWTRL